MGEEVTEMKQGLRVSGSIAPCDTTIDREGAALPGTHFRLALQGVNKVGLAELALI